MGRGGLEGRRKRGDDGREFRDGFASHFGVFDRAFLGQHPVVERIGVHLDLLVDFGRAVVIREVAEGFEESLFVAT